MKYIKYFVFSLCLFFDVIVNASVNNTYVNLNDFEYSNDNKDFSNIKEYKDLDDFIEEYKSDKLPNIYITDFLFDGVSNVLVPDLDDFIEKDSNEVELDKLNIKVLNINMIGDIELTGESKGLMVAVNTNGLIGDLNIILNSVNIDTDSKKAPVLYVYNKDINYTGCKVTIKTKKDTKNYLEGGKLKKVSLVGKDKLNDYKDYYTGNNLENYNKYSSYYGIYDSSDINDILFASVKADNEGLNDGDPYYFYKASGAVSSDIDLYFEGDGYLKVTSKNNEGIESKGNLSFIGGKGDYEVSSFDDCLNTTTAKSIGENVRNDLVIDVNSLIAIVNDEGDEGDAIDSNGTLTINGGTIYAFAHFKSQDAGLDSESGTYINGGTIIATGNMADRIANESKQKYIYVEFDSSIEAGTLLVLKDQKDKFITAFKTNKNIKTLFYSDSDLEYESFKIYSGGNIDGEDINGLYTKINSYTGGKEISYKEIKNSGLMGNQCVDISNGIFKAFVIEIISLFILIVYAVLDEYFRNNKIED